MRGGSMEERMMEFHAETSIDAQPDIVFKTIAEPERFAQAIGGVKVTEFLTSTRSGAGTCYRQTRRIDGREMTMDFEIKECRAPDSVRIVNETGGTLWDSAFTLRVIDRKTVLRLVMTATPPGFFARFFIRMFRKKIQAGVERDLNAVRDFCERGLRRTR